MFGALLIGERLGLHRLAALGLGMVGAVWIVFRGEPARLIALEITIGDGIFLAGCVAFGVYGALIKRLHRDEPVMVLTFWTLAAATLWLVLASNVKLWRTDWVEVEVVVLGGIVYLAIFPTIITFFIAQYATLRLGPTRLMAYSYLIPAMVLLIDLASGTGPATGDDISGHRDRSARERRGATRRHPRISIVMTRLRARLGRRRCWTAVGLAH